MEYILKKKHLFWDVAAEKLNKQTDWFFIIERLLEYGDIEDWSWLKENFSHEQISAVATNSRILSPKIKSLLKVMRYAS